MSMASFASVYSRATSTIGKVEGFLLWKMTVMRATESEGPKRSMSMTVFEVSPSSSSTSSSPEAMRALLG